MRQENERKANFKSCNIVLAKRHWTKMREPLSLSLSVSPLASKGGRKRFSGAGFAEGVGLNNIRSPTIQCYKLHSDGTEIAHRANIRLLMRNMPGGRKIATVVKASFVSAPFFASSKRLQRRRRLYSEMARLMEDR